MLSQTTEVDHHSNLKPEMPDGGNSGETKECNLSTRKENSSMSKVRLMDKTEHSLSATKTSNTVKTGISSTRKT